MTEHELTRRDALAALSAAGVGALAGCATPTESPGDHERDTLVAVARTVYPSGVSGVEGFVTTYVDGRLEDRPERASGVVEAVERLDAHTEAWYNDPFVALDPADRDGALRSMGVDRVDPDPDGDPAARVRFYLVNELLYGLFTSPTGGELVGLENPQGYPGGTDSYRRGP